MTKITRVDDIEPLTRSPNYKVNVSLTFLPKWLEEQESEHGLNLNPDFQRAHVWTQAQQVKFVEFILRGGTSAQNIYFNDPAWQKSVGECSADYTDFVIVDGKQRLQALMQFLNNEIPAFGSLLREFDRPAVLLRRNINIALQVNDLKTRKEVLQWYIDINSAGTPHTNCELARVKRLLEKL